MKYSQPKISKITERGQITLPKKIRETRAFATARAVVFSQIDDVVTISPIKEVVPKKEHSQILNATLSDWSEPVNDNLFDFSA